MITRMLFGHRIFLGINSNSTGKCHLYPSTKHVNIIAKSTETSAFKVSHMDKRSLDTVQQKTCRTVSEEKTNIQSKEISG